MFDLFSSLFLLGFLGYSLSSVIFFYGSFKSKTGLKIYYLFIVYAISKLRQIFELYVAVFANSYKYISCLMDELFEKIS